MLKDKYLNPHVGVVAGTLIYTMMGGIEATFHGKKICMIHLHLSDLWTYKITVLAQKETDEI